MVVSTSKDSLIGMSRLPGWWHVASWRSRVLSKSGLGVSAKGQEGRSGERGWLRRSWGAQTKTRMRSAEQIYRDRGTRRGHSGEKKK